MVHFSYKRAMVPFAFGVGATLFSRLSHRELSPYRRMFLLKVEPIHS